MLLLRRDRGVLVASSTDSGSGFSPPAMSFESVGPVCTTTGESESRRVLDVLSSPGEKSRKARNLSPVLLRRGDGDLSDLESRCACALPFRRIESRSPSRYCRGTVNSDDELFSLKARCGLSPYGCTC